MKNILEMVQKQRERENQKYENMMTPRRGLSKQPPQTPPAQPPSEIKEGSYHYPLEVRSR